MNFRRAWRKPALLNIHRSTTPAGFYYTHTHTHTHTAPFYSRSHSNKLLNRRVLSNMQCYKTWLYGIQVLTSGIAVVYNVLQCCCLSTRADLNYKKNKWAAMKILSSSIYAHVVHNQLHCLQCNTNGDVYYNVALFHTTKVKCSVQERERKKERKKERK